MDARGDEVGHEEEGRRTGCEEAGAAHAESGTSPPSRKGSGKVSVYRWFTCTPTTGGRPVDRGTWWSSSRAGRPVGEPKFSSKSGHGSPVHLVHLYSGSGAIEAVYQRQSRTEVNRPEDRLAGGAA